MSLNEFDKLLKERFDEHEFAYNDANWDKLARQLPEKSHKVLPFPWLKLTGVAAALAITVSGISYFSNKHESVDIAQKVTPPALLQAQTPNPSLAKAVVPDNHTDHIPAKTAVSSKNSVTSTAKRKAASSNIITATPAMVPVDYVPAKTSEHTTAPEVAKNEIITERQEKKDAPANIAFNNEIAFEPTARLNKTFVSLTGGMNFGSMNTGYMAGINAKQKLSKKIFLESDLAIVGNTASQTFSRQQIPINTGGSLKGAPIDYKNTNLVYVQVNPTVGYQLMKKVSVGVGADLQQMLNGGNTLVNVNDETKTIPASDFGLTGKTEISISPKIKAGILYREGINNLVNGSSDYFDRSYLQVQLKWTVLHK
jgi:hypothetical protein